MISVFYWTFVEGHSVSVQINDGGLLNQRNEFIGT